MRLIRIGSCELMLRVKEHYLSLAAHAFRQFLMEESAQRAQEAL